MKKQFFIVPILLFVGWATGYSQIISITNPSFETGDYTGWTWTGRNGGWEDVNQDGDHTKEGMYIAGYWNAGIGDVECYQEITVPNGVYKISALVTVHKNRISNQRLFANNNSTLYGAKTHPAYTVENLQILKNLGEEVTFAGIEGSLVENGPFVPISVETEVTDGKLRFGFKTSGHESSLGFSFNYTDVGYDVGFFKFDAFKINDDEEADVVIGQQGLTAQRSGVVTEISFYTPSIVRVQKYDVDEQVAKNNLVVMLTPETVAVAADETEDLVTLSSDDLTVVFDKTNGQVTFFDRNGNNTLREKPEAFEITAKKDGNFDSYKVRQTFTLEENEQIYGLGQLINGSLSQRGKSYWHMIQGNTTVWIPYIHSVKGYALYWDNYSPTTFIDDASGMSFDSDAGYGINYYYLGGSSESGDVTVSQMRKLSGKAPMIPLWAYGYFQSKERYQSANETMGVVKKYRDLGVPLDCIVQDWQYWGGNNQWNAMEFLNPQFTNYQEMIDSVHNMNAKIIISFWANFGPDTKQYAHLKDMNALIKSGNSIMTDTYPSNEGVAIYDTYSKDARDYIWDCVYGGLSSKGIDAYWMDSSEPDHYQGGAEMEKTFDFVTGLGTTWRSVRNAYPLLHVGGIHDNHRAEQATNHKRVTILTRSAFAGQQRYGANTWSGDVTASWETLANQIPASLNFTMCGLPNWNSDIGGFFNGEYAGAGDEAYNELYTRWLQFGTFSTMMRSHGAGSDRAIYRFGEPGTIYYDVIEKYINLRYALLPYIYSTAWDVHKKDGSFMRALPLAYPLDENTHHVKYDYLFGNSLLVAPVLEPEARSRQVYLPGGSDWVDFWSGEKVSGGQSVAKKVDLHTMPIYVKSGSIIPWGPKVQYSTEQRWDSLEVRIYRGADGSFVLYEDEFDNYNYEQGAYTETPFYWNEATRELTIGDRTGSYSGMLENRKFAIVLVDEGIGVGSEQSNLISKIIDYNGTSLTVKIDNDQVIDNSTDVVKKEADFFLTKEFFPLDETSKVKFWYGEGPGSYDVNNKTVSFNGVYQSWGWGYGAEGEHVTNHSAIDTKEYNFLVAKLNHVEDLLIFRLEYYDSNGVLHTNEERDGHGNLNPDARIQFGPGTNEDNYSFMKNADGTYTIKVNLEALDVYKVTKVYFWNAWENPKNSLSLEEVYFTNSHYYSIETSADQFRTICTPRSMNSKTSGVNFYTVSGVDDRENPTKLYLDEYSGELQAGIPYFYKSLSSKIYFELMGDYSTTAGSVSGLTGVYEDMSFPFAETNYMIDRGILIPSDQDHVISSYTAYVNMSEVPLYSGNGDNEYVEVQKDITSVGVIHPSQSNYVDVYSIMGVCIKKNVEKEQALKGLSRGVYIVGGRKVVVSGKF